MAGLKNGLVLVETLVDDIEIGQEVYYSEKFRKVVNKNVDDCSDEAFVILENDETQYSGVLFVVKRNVEFIKVQKSFMNPNWQQRTIPVLPADKNMVKLFDAIVFSEEKNG